MQSVAENFLQFFLRWFLWY